MLVFFNKNQYLTVTVLNRPSFANAEYLAEFWVQQSGFFFTKVKDARLRKQVTYLLPCGVGLRATHMLWRALRRLNAAFGHVHTGPPGTGKTMNCLAYCMIWKKHHPHY